MSAIDKVGVGKRIKFYRKKLNLSQTVIGDVVGATKATASQWEKGLFLPKRPDLIAFKLQISERHLLYGDDAECQFDFRAALVLEKFNLADDTTKAIIERILEI